MKKKMPRWIASVILSLGTIIVVTLAGYYFIASTKGDVDLQNRQYLSEIAVQNAQAMKTAVELELDKIESLANIIGSQEVFSVDFAMEILNAESQRKDFKRLGYIPPDGNAITTDGAEFNVLDREYYGIALTGISSVSDMIEDKAGGGLINVYAVPVYYKEEMQGVIIATKDTTVFSELMEVSTFSGEGFSYVIKKDGTPVVYEDNNATYKKFDNLFDEIQKGGISDEEILQMQNDMDANRTGMIEYKMDNFERIGAYSKVGVNDWYSISVVNYDVISRNSDRLVERNVLSVMLTIVLFGALVTFIILQNHKSNLQLSELAFTDPLTGGNNLNKFKELATEQILENNGQLYMVRLDVDNFRLINDMYGYEEGNKILLAMDRLIGTILSEENIYGRVGSDNFVCLIHYKSEEEVVEVGGKFREAFRQFLQEEKKNYVVNFTTGIYKIPDYEADIDKMIDKATMAHRIAKKQPQERKFFFYNDKIRDEALKVKNIEDIMHQALEQREFKVYLQPKYNLKTGEMEGAEALVRWVRDEKILSPAEFIPIFERNGFIVNMDMFVLEEVCRLQKRWLDFGLKPVPISVNQSKPLVYSQDYVEKLYQMVKKYELPSYLIELELLESLVHDNLSKLKEVTEKLRAYGFLVCIDDFGSGYSSLNLIKDICVDVLKIDREFLSSAETNGRAEVVLQNIIDLAKGLKMAVVTEGVETQKQVELLKKLQCDTVQGFLYARPMPAEQYEERVPK